jgi:hypothetical protein
MCKPVFHFHVIISAFDPFIQLFILVMSFSFELPSIFHVLQLPLLQVNNIVALALGPERQALRVAVTLPILIILITQSFYLEWNLEWSIQYAYNCFTLSVAFLYVDCILLKSPDRERWRKLHYTQKEAGGKETSEEVPKGFWNRAWWGVRLSTTNRYVGWTCQVKNVPEQVSAEYPRLYIPLIPLHFNPLR